MVKTGTVKAKKDGKLSVCFEKPEACAGCKGCSVGLLPNKELMTVYGEAEIGDTVAVSIPENKSLSASLLAYAVPMIMMIAVLAIATALGCREWLSLILAVAGLAIGFLISRFAEKKLSRRTDWRPTVVGVQKAGKEQEK